MILFRQIRSFLLATVLTVMLAVTVAFVGPTNAWAATASTLLVSQPKPQLAAIDRVDAMGKNLEGKVQEAIGNVTGDSKNQLMGKVKQAEAQARHTDAVTDPVELQDKAKAITENLADAVTDPVELQGRAKAITKNLEGKAQEAIGNVTGDPKDQLMGNVKQAESQDRHFMEDVKDKIQDIFN